MSAQHTAGPWVFHEQGDANEFALLTVPEGRWIISFRQNGELMREKQLANARLIAAAPELLDALRVATEELVYFVNFAARQAEFQGDIEAGEMAVKCGRAAIAKATGVA